MADVFWLSNAQWAVIEPFMPKNQPGPEREDDRRIISGIVQRPDGQGRPRPSTRPTSRPTARRKAAKGGSCAGHWPVARRADDQDPRPR